MAEWPGVRPDPVAARKEIQQFKLFLHTKYAETRTPMKQGYSTAVPETHIHKDSELLTYSFGLQQPPIYGILTSCDRCMQRTCSAPPITLLQQNEQ